jgi:hypothetical protein
VATQNLINMVAVSVISKMGLLGLLVTKHLGAHGFAVRMSWNIGSFLRAPLPFSLDVSDIAAKEAKAASRISGP